MFKIKELGSDSLSSIMKNFAIEESNKLNMSWKLRKINRTKKSRCVRSEPMKNVAFG